MVVLSASMDVHAHAQGAKALRVWMAVVNLSCKELAAKLDVDPHTVSRWRKGTGRPEGDARIKLERLTEGDVPATIWMREDAAA